MKPIISTLNNKKGSTIIVVILILALLTIIGMSATSTSTTEVQISSNDLLHKKAFITAESGWQVSVNWLDAQAPLITIDSGLDTSGGDIDFSSAKFANPDSFALGTTNRYSVAVTFNGVAFAPGYSTEFKRHNYIVSSTGTGSRDSNARVVVSAGKIGYVGGY